MQDVFRKLDELRSEISQDRFGKSDPWQGADVVITEAPVSPSVGHFYPDPRLVVTAYVGELSWLFEKLVPIFSAVDEYGLWKEELFGRLGNMANRAKALDKANSAKELLLAVLHEAYACAEELEEGNFNFLLVTTENSIYEDLIVNAMHGKFESESKVEKFLMDKGLL